MLGIEAGELDDGIWVKGVDPATFVPRRPASLYSRVFILISACECSPPVSPPLSPAATSRMVALPTDIYFL